MMYASFILGFHIFEVLTRDRPFQIIIVFIFVLFAALSFISLNNPKLNKEQIIWIKNRPAYALLFITLSLVFVTNPFIDWLFDGTPILISDPFTGISLAAAVFSILGSLIFIIQMLQD